MTPATPARQSPFIRRATSLDIPPVHSLAQQSASSAHWPSTAFSQYVLAPADIDPVRRVLFAALACGGAGRQTAVRCIGFAAFTLLACTGTAELDNMAVAPAWQRQGIGRRLLSAGVLWCRSRHCSQTIVSPSGPEPCGLEEGLRLLLEVRASNQAAIALYLASGFRETGRRPAYYPDPVEDAILMAKPLRVRSQ